MMRLWALTAEMPFAARLRAALLLERLSMLVVVGPVLVVLLQLVRRAVLTMQVPA